LNSFLSKLAPLTTLMADSDAELNEETESVMYFVRGASFVKKEFKRNVAGSGAYAPTTTVLATPNTLHKLNKSKLSGLVNVFTMVFPWVRWWWCCSGGGGGGGGGGG
jgi:hypothetical protein